MRTIVQYEVYVLIDDRWALHARYPGAERDEAISDARQTEVEIGFPTKVVKDTYYPEENYSEETDAYVSPNVKIKKKRKKKSVTNRVSTAGARAERASKNSASSKRSTKQLRFNGPVFFSRLLMSLAGGIAIAAALTAIFSVLLSALPKLGVVISSSYADELALYWFLSMFVLSTTALNRAYVPWRSVFAQADQRPKAPVAQEAYTPAPKMTFKPKHSDTARELEVEQARQEIKVMRGDIPPPDNSVGTETGASFQNEDTPPVTLPVEPPPPEPPAETEEPSGDTTGKSGDASGNEELKHKPEAEAKEAAQGPEPLDDLDMERLMMVRFLGDTLVTLKGSREQLDAPTRFAMSLYLAGAASAVADRRGLTPAEEKDLLAESLHLIGHSKTMIDSFVDKYDDNLDVPKNRDLMAAGLSAMTEHLQATDSPVKNLTNIIDQWKKEALEPKIELGDIFLLTHLISPLTGPVQTDAEAMDQHNRNVRKVLEENKGEEVRHTGKGIFASFEHPDDAICAAISIQQANAQDRNAGSRTAKLCIAIVGSLPGEDDPVLSGDAFSQSDTLCRRLSDGQIACDDLVRKASKIQKVQFGNKIPNAHSGIAEKVNAFEILWDPLPV